MHSLPITTRIWRAAAWLMLAVIVSLVLCTTAFYYHGQKVDESEIVMNAVAIASGGWSPEWPGYGHLGMYIAAIALSVSSLLLHFVGVVSSYTEGIYLLFENEGAYRVTRFVYTLADVLTALLLARVIVKVTGQRLVAILFFFGFLLSATTWFYANHIRADSLVSFFVAVAVYATAMGRSRSTPYVVGLAIGAAFACKYSALPYLALVIVLAIDEPDRLRSWKQRISMMAIATFVALLAAIALQPRYNFVGVLSAASNHLSGSQFTSQANSMGDRLVRLGELAGGIEPLALFFALFMWFALLRFQRSAGLLLAAILGILPFAASNFAREYWLIPFADAIRAAGWLGIACLVELVRARVRQDHQRWVTAGLLVAAAGILWVGVSDINDRRGGKRGVKNSETAKQWLYINAVNRIPLVYSYEKNYILPRAYSFEDYEGAAYFSRIFIFKRNKFDSLHALFNRRFYEHEYREFSESTQVPQLRMSVGSGTAGRVNGKLLLCAGNNCYKPKRTRCDAAQTEIMGKCFTYSWDMDKPALKRDLRDVELRIGAPISAYAMCWYNCNKQGAPLIRKTLSGEVSLISLGSYLFAPTRMKPLEQIAKPGGLGPGEYLVTSRTAYMPWLKKTGVDMSGKKQSPAKILAEHIGLEPVQEFRRDAGPVIEIYRKKAEPKPKAAEPNPPVPVEVALPAGTQAH